MADRLGAILNAEFQTVNIQKNIDIIFYVFPCLAEANTRFSNVRVSNVHVDNNW